KASKSLAAPHDHHTTFVHTGDNGSALYVVGGFNQQTNGVYADILRAPIDAKGALGAWGALASLPSPRSGHFSVDLNGYLVVGGGKDDSFANRAEVFIAKLDGDGSLGQWQDGAALPANRFHHSAAAAGEWIYVSGGLGDDGMATN